MSSFSRTPDNEHSASAIRAALRSDDNDGSSESSEDELPTSTRPAYTARAQVSRSRVFDEHRNDIAMMISATYEFQTFFPSDQLDTYIWLRVPNANDAAKKMACTGICFQSSWLLPYSSDALRRSELSKFAELLNDEKYQLRTRNRMVKAGVVSLHNTSELKRYFLDLGPSDDSDLHAEHLEALTLPQGIIRYSTMVNHEIDSAPADLAGGHDDACSCFQLGLARGQANDAEHSVADASGPATGTGQSNTYSSLRRGEASTGAVITVRPRRGNIDANSIWDGRMEPEYQIADYCEIRHICNVIRLLMAIAGHHVLLNSAARVYTLAGLAKMFGLKSSDGYFEGRVPLYADYATFSNNFRGTMSKWFFHPGNSKIIDILPEECFIIAWNLKLAPVARSAFRILVAESALHKSNGAQPHKPQSRRTTPFGRELSGLLDDEMETLVGYASDALVQRVLQRRDAMKEEMFVMTSNARLDHIAGNVAGGPPIYNLAKCPMFKRAQDGIIHTLVELSDTLETFAFAEQAIVSNCTEVPFTDAAMGSTNAIQAAFASVQAFLRHIAVVLADKYCGTSMSTAFSMHNQSFEQSIQPYRRRRREEGRNWVTQVYRELSDNQKCMTTLYWNNLWSTSRSTPVIMTELPQTHAALLQRVSDVVSEAVTPNPENARMGRTAEIQLRGLQRDLLSRLSDLGLATENGPSDRMTDLFDYGMVTDALKKLFCESILDIYDPAFYSPCLEIHGLHPSPHLVLSLSDDEFRFLPMWAGGNNDDTGAVFEDALPVADLGPAGPGPAYHTGQTIASAASTAGADSSSASVVAFSAAGPPSVSDGVGSFRDFDGLRLSDAGTDRAASIASGSTDYQAAREFAGLDIQSQRQGSEYSGSIADSYVAGSAFDMTGSSTSDNRDISSLTGQRSAMSSSNRSLAASSGMAGSFVVVEDETPRTADVPTATSNSDDDFDDFGVEFDYDDDDDDDDDNMQEFIDDDDADARSDDTVMPDREEILESMRQSEAHV